MWKKKKKYSRTKEEAEKNKPYQLTAYLSTAAFILAATKEGFPFLLQASSLLLSCVYAAQRSCSLHPAYMQSGFTAGDYFTSLTDKLCQKSCQPAIQS